MGATLLQPCSGRLAELTRFVPLPAPRHMQTTLYRLYHVPITSPQPTHALPTACPQPAQLSLT